MSLTDAAFVGHISSKELAAVGLSMGSLFPLLFGAIALVSTGGIFVAEAQVNKNHLEVKSSLDLSLWTCILFSPLLMFGGAMLPALFEITGQDSSIVNLSSQYLNVVIWSIPPILGFSVFRTFVAALNKNSIVFSVSLVGVVLNAVLNYILVFGKFGAPALGIVGSAISTTVSSAIMLALMALYCARRLDYRFSLSTYSVVKSFAALELLRLGGPAFGIGLIESSQFGIVTILAGQYGVNFLAATTIAIFVSDLFIVIALGLGDQLTVDIAAFAASGDRVSCRKLAIAGIGLMTLTCVPMAAACIFYPNVLVSMFLDSSNVDAASVLNISQELLAVLAVFLFADGAQVVLSRSLKGLRDTLVPMWIAATGYWIVGIGGGWWLANRAEWGGIGLWYGLAAGLTLSSVAMGFRMHFKVKSTEI
ncbi:matE: MATE efflux family protein [Solimicrobium silvestre]|uniref:MatE: MATE efflux family protein n=2 Tax=Solimicrobium silvestre TaxID=2099400 RepID=A0A2S9H2K4_9BURK|nr:matE: MATE efflux family protein [Solimicrobium silvestre]